MAIQDLGTTALEVKVPASGFPDEPEAGHAVPGPNMELVVSDQSVGGDIGEHQSAGVQEPMEPSGWNNVRGRVLLPGVAG